MWKDSLPDTITLSASAETNWDEIEDKDKPDLIYLKRSRDIAHRMWSVHNKRTILKDYESSTDPLFPDLDRTIRFDGIDFINDSQVEVMVQGKMKWVDKEDVHGIRLLPKYKLLLEELSNSDFPRYVTLNVKLTAKISFDGDVLSSRPHTEGEETVSGYVTSDTHTCPVQTRINPDGVDVVVKIVK